MILEILKAIIDDMEVLRRRLYFLKGAITAATDSKQGCQDFEPTIETDIKEK